MTVSSSSYDWVRKVNPELKKLDAIPLTGNAPPFPWDNFSSSLARSFDCKSLSILPGEITWRAQDNLYEEMGDSLFPLNLSLLPIKGKIAWVIPAQEISLLTDLLLTKESHTLPIQDPHFNESFYHFLALEALHLFTKVTVDQTLSPLLLDDKELPNKHALCWDITLQVNQYTIKGRLIISPEFRQSWVDYFAKNQQSSLLTKQLACAATVNLHLEVGKTELNFEQWINVKLGDFLTLDSCSLDPEHLEGRAILTYNGKPAFRTKIKNGTLKILELPLLEEVDTVMAKHPEDEDPLSDLDLPEDFDEFDEFDEEDDLFDEELDGPQPKASENDSSNVTDSPETTEIHETKKEGEINKNSHQESVLPETPPAAQEPEELLSPKNIPVTLIVEMGQIQITMDQLLQLEPGNMLDINLHPENGVDLTANGKKVAKGELMRIGDVIGVRIVQLGS